MDQAKSWTKIAKSLRKKIPQVYSGVWNTRAFMEREWFQLHGDQHLRVKVALAIHQAFPSHGFGGNLYEVANGVAATKNIYRDNSASGIDELYINGQHLDLSVTNPPTSQELAEKGFDSSISYRTEENLVTAYANDDNLNNRSDAFRWWFSQRLVSSSIPLGPSVLVDDPDQHGNFQQMEVRRLSGAFQYLRKQMARVYSRPFREFHIEGEWKVIGPNRILMIKQMREFATAD